MMVLMNKTGCYAEFLFVLLLTLSIGVGDIHAQSKNRKNVLFPSNNLAIAHKVAAGVIQIRKDHMKSMGAEIKRISAMIRGKRPFDGSKIAAASERIAGHGHKSGRLLPEGTWNIPSRASPKIWKDWGGFTLAMNTMVRAATILAESGRAGNRSKVKAAHNALDKSCSGCHRIYRLKKRR